MNSISGIRHIKFISIVIRKRIMSIIFEVSGAFAFPNLRYFDFPKN
jgi:hypothetical protein